MDAGGTARAAAADEIGQRRQPRACAAVVVDQRAEGARAHIVAADEAFQRLWLFVAVHEMPDNA
jgi:hypothetical protein